MGGTKDDKNGTCNPWGCREREREREREYSLINEKNKIMHIDSYLSVHIFAMSKNYVRDG